MENVLTEFVDYLTGGIVNLASGIGGGVNQFVTDLFLTTSTEGTVTGLSTFGGVVAVFGE